MGNPVHTVEVLNGSSSLSNPDRVKLLMQFAVANAAGGSAGAAVTTAITGLELPANYMVDVEPGQDATWYIASKTQSGFSVVMNPRLAANTLAAGSFNVRVMG